MTSRVLKLIFEHKTWSVQITRLRTPVDLTTNSVTLSVLMPAADIEGKLRFCRLGESDIVSLLTAALLMSSQAKRSDGKDDRSVHVTKSPFTYFKNRDQDRARAQK